MVGPALGGDGIRDMVLVFLQQLHDLKNKTNFNKLTLIFTNLTENTNIFQNRRKYLPCHFQLGQRRRPGWWRAWWGRPCATCPSRHWTCVARCLKLIWKLIFIWKSIWNLIWNGILLPKLFWPTVRKNCSSDREKHLKFKAEGQEFAKFLRSLQGVQTRYDILETFIRPSKMQF